jgi:hypothetical protein
MSDQPSIPAPLRERLEALKKHDCVSCDHTDERSAFIAGYNTALREALSLLGAPETPACVCQVEDGLVQEWVSKARAVAWMKGYQVAPAASPVSPGEPETPAKVCVCAIPDPVMQADRRFYCHTCGLPRPSQICERCQAIVPAESPVSGGTEQ